MRLDHGALVVADEQRAREFYVGALGLAEIARPSNFDFPGLWVRVGDQEIHIIRGRGARPDWTADELAGGFASHLAIEVEDFDGFLARLRIPLVGGPRERGDGVRQAYVQDPDGHVIEIMGG
jgi:catechol 2,3-dioxygenase-like lactoylglutathione lyase family enzyme